MSKKAGWFEVDKDGLAKVLARRGKEFIIFELLSNALDEDVTQVTITLTQPKSGVSTLTVVDDSPDGFENLSHAWTLFAESKKNSGDCVFRWHPTPRNEATRRRGRGYGKQTDQRNETGRNHGRPRTARSMPSQLTVSSARDCPTPRKARTNLVRAHAQRCITARLNSCSRIAADKKNGAHRIIVSPRLRDRVVP